MAVEPECSDLMAALDSDWQKLYQHLGSMQERQREMLAVVHRPCSDITNNAQAAKSSLEDHVTEDGLNQCTSTDCITSTPCDCRTDSHLVVDAELNTPPEAAPALAREFRTAYASQMRSLSSVSTMTQLEAYFGKDIRYCARCWQSLLHTLLVFGRKYMHCCFEDEPARTSFCARFVDGIFSDLCNLTIVLNVALLVVTTDRDMSQPLLNSVTEARYLRIERGFAVFYATELILKIAVHRLYFFFGSQCWWNLMDCVLVIVSVYDFVGTAHCGFSENVLYMNRPCEQYGWEPDVVFLRVLRVFKMTKVFRLARLMRVFKELRLLVNSLLGSFKALLWCFVMISFMFFMFSVLFVQISANYLSSGIYNDQDDEWVNLQLAFGSVSTTMLHLFQDATGGDWTVRFSKIRNISWELDLLYIFFIAFMNISLLNIVTGIFVESAMKFAKPDLESQAIAELREQAEKLEDFYSIVEQMDLDQDGYLTVKEFVTFITKPRVMAELTVLGIGIRDAEMLFEMLYTASKGAAVPIKAFVDGCLRLRGPATGIDLHGLLFRTELLDEQQQAFRDMCTTQLKVISATLANLVKEEAQEIRL